MQTLAEALAIATLRGDLVAAYALADRLLEERAEGAMPEARAAQLRQETGRVQVLGEVVWMWPEFQAFIHRLGVAASLSTMALTIQLTLGEPVLITQEYMPRAEGG